MTEAHAARTNQPFAPSGDAVIHVARVGAEQCPVVMIDGALRDPEALRAFAIRDATFAPVEDNLYPGVRAPIPLDYARAMTHVLDPLIRRAWALDGAVAGKAECFFSIVTTPPQDLVPFQRVPHIDTTSPLQFAVLHFLCGPECGGTALYRQRATGFETITAEREPAWARARDAALARASGRPCYVADDDPDYEEIALMPAQYNRLLVYRSNQLHSGRIPVGMPFTPDPAHGRLTANLFIGYRPG
jgi:hypothetical protein